MKSVYVIAEAGVNHNGSLDMALELVDVAAMCGADAVKFQTFKVDRLVKRSAEKAEYQKRVTGEEETQFEMLKKLELSESDHERILMRCKEKRIQFLSTPFDFESGEYLNKIGIPLFKVGSGDLTNAPLLYRIARFGKPLILSTGMATLSDVEEALSVLAFGYTAAHTDEPSVTAFKRAFSTESGQNALRENVTLLHCTTEYPSPLCEVNLSVMQTLRQAFALPVGYSDHTEGTEISVAAVALGATVIEKHFTLDKTLPGPDHQASLEPSEFEGLVSGIRSVEQALGSRVKHVTESEWKNATVARKSLVAADSIKFGDIFTENNLTLKRPGSGVRPIHYWDYIGKMANRDYEADDEIE